MNKILTIIKKELKRIFTDKRMLAGLILPGILIYFIYSFMGTMLTKSLATENNYEYKVVSFNEPDSLKAINETENYNIKIESNELSVDEAKSMLAESSVDLVIIYDENFESKIASENPPSVMIYYNSTSTESTEIFSYYTAVLSGMSVKTYNFYVNNKVDEVFDLASKEDTSAMIIKMIVPYLLVIFLFSGCLSVAPESIAGEKERGTIATLLVTPVKRRDIALGKVISLAIAALVSSISSFLGVMLSLPKLMGNTEGLTLSMYNALTFIEVFALMIVTVLIFTVILSIISTFAKSVKEASQYAMPVMVIVMLLAIPTMMGAGFSDTILLYFVPVLNVLKCMTAIFSMSFNLLNFVITILSNIVYISAGVYVLTKMFDSEKIMFNK